MTVMVGGRNAGWLANLDQERASGEQGLDALVEGVSELLDDQDSTLLVASLARSMYSDALRTQLSVCLAVAVVRLAKQKKGESHA